jgi:molybdopterin synthase catalytic subunit
VEDKMVILQNGALDTQRVISQIYSDYRQANFGAIINFIGVVRAEDGIEALSFDIYKPILNSWFSSWQKKANSLNSDILMVHSIGDVPIHETSFIATVLSPKRRLALDMIDEFVEDFKQNAPIWKYDVIAGERIYALERSQKLNGAGILK